MSEINLEKLLENMDSRKGCDIVYYIDDVLPARGRYAVLGMAGSGKTTVVFDQVLHISCGQDWMGHRTTPCRVLWLNLNDEPAIATKIRLDKMLHSLGLSQPPERLMIVNQSDWQDMPFSMKTKFETDNTYELINTWNTDILVVDSLRKFLPFKDQVMDVKPLRDLFNDYPDMVQLLIHHAQQKGITAAELFSSQDPGSYMANSSELARDVDGFFIVTGHTKNNILDHISLRAVSKRFTMLDRNIRIDVEQDGKTTFKLNYGGLYIPELRLEQKHIIDILKNAGKDGMSVSELVNSSETVLGRATVYRYIEELYDTGWIELVSRRGRGKRFYVLTEEGRKNLPAL
jgi:hypothetical protein